MAGEITIELSFRNQRFRDAEVGLRAFADTIGKKWDGAPKVLSDELRDFLGTVVDALAERHGEAWPGGTSSQHLSVRSGSLIQSIRNSVRVEGDTFAGIRGYVGAAFPGRVHEYGATIKAKNHLLTIPLKAALDSRGVPLKKSARDWKNTFVAKTKKGNLLIFQKVGTQVIPLYVLKDQVTIPPRLGMGQTINTGIPYFVDRAADAIAKAFVGA